jgi:hypothetical protein
MISGGLVNRTLQIETGIKSLETKTARRCRRAAQIFDL